MMNHFRQLVRQWLEERPKYSSSIAELIACPSYLRIIALGPIAVPLILEQMRQEGDDPDHWHAALEAITGENPVPEDARGDTVRIAEAWIAWSEEGSECSVKVDSQTYVTVAIESPVPPPLGTIASPGLPEMMDDGGGLTSISQSPTGHQIFQESVLSEPLHWSFKSLDTKNA